MAKRQAGVYVAEIKRRYKDRVYVGYLLRRTYRENGKVKQETLGNLSRLPIEAIQTLRQILRGETYVPVDQAMEIVRTRSHGHVACVRAMMDRLKLDRVLDPQPSRERALVLALIAARVVEPLPKLATTRWWQTTSLAVDPVVAEATEDDLYQAMDWLAERQGRIERALASRHLSEGGLVLYDVSSSYVEGSHCPPPAFGQGRRQINYGLLLDAEGRPVGVELYPGNTADPKTVDAQLQKIRQRFGLQHVVLVGDRGMLTSARIDHLKEVGGLDWISALRAKDIQRLRSAGAAGLSLFDQRDLAEVTSPEFPGERLIVCRNPFLAEERARKRQELLAQTEKLLARLAQRVASGRLKRKEKIAEALGRIKNRYHVAKHFICEVEEGHFAYRRREEKIQREAELDGIYVIRTSVPAESLPAEQAVRSYKELARAERAFRTLKSVDLRVRPIHHWTANRVRAHFLLCMLAYYVEWHLRQAWAPFLFDDEEPGQHRNGSPVQPALRSSQALQKARRHQTQDGLPVHSFRTLLADLGTIAWNEVRIPARPELPSFTVLTTPTPFQREVCARVGLDLTGGRRQNRTG